jgi:hypothetical protein
MACSDIWAICQRKCKNGKTEVSLVAQLVWNHYLWVQGAYLCKVYNCHDSSAYGYKRPVILFWLDDMVWMEWDDSGLACVEPYDL